MKLRYARIIYLIVTPTLLMTACNKDDVIESPGQSEDSGIMRPLLPESKAESDRVYEWIPAPGQFVNETAGGADKLFTPEDAAAWAHGRLQEGKYVTLGGFGGYIVVGFDHSVVSSRGDYDFAIAGNAFYNGNSGAGGSSEPGIVYVMQDSNGNELPDDEWFELRGSEYGDVATICDYEVTYYRPSTPKQSVEWSDNKGNSGEIDYLAAFHKQDYYYPAWVAADSYTLKGICLKPRNIKNPETGMWDNNPYGWGYADNMGSDNFSTVSYPQCNRFRISDAVDSDGSPADLEYIDFVKVQTGVNAKSGWLGEVSTEVSGFFDLHL